MVGSIKCLRTLLIAGFYSAMTINLSECKPDFNMDALLTGENNKSQTKVTNSDATSHLSTPTEDEHAKRDWSKFNSWGKRGWDKMNFASWGKRHWRNFASWGKRSVDPSQEDMSDSQMMPKRKWSQFNSWGKRTASELPGDSDTVLSDLGSSDKRSKEEFQNEMAVNKRKWSQFASWGKRNVGDDDEYLTPYKRKWSQFASWGKRDTNEIPDHSDYLVDYSYTPEKRKWSQFASWGKRDSPILNDTPEKRKWSQFASWGKRMDDTDLTPVDKRGWAEFNSWGKRLRNARNWAALNTWGKRRWTGLPTWGKRSAGPMTVDPDIVVDKLIRFFDTNDDQQLDVDELRTYIRTLMSLPTDHNEIGSDEEVKNER